jgi:hypothetical protein
MELTTARARCVLLSFALLFGLSTARAQTAAPPSDNQAAVANLQELDDLIEQNK